MSECSQPHAAIMWRQRHAVSGVGVLVPLGQLEQDDVPFLIVDVVEQTVGSDAKPLLGDELRYDNLACQPFCAFPSGGGLLANDLMAAAMAAW